MSGISFWELVIIFVIGLIVLGPERLPRVASQLGTWLGQARRMSRVLKRQLEDELNLEKDLNIRPRPAPKALPATPAPRYDEPYVPADAADSPGTGTDQPVGNTQPEDDPQPVGGQSPDAGAAGDQGGESGGEAADDRATAAGNNKT